MKKTLHSLFPILFGLALFFFYISIYSSPIGSESFSTAVLVFFTALGGSAVIIFPWKKGAPLFYCYLPVSVGVPFLLVLFAPFFNTVPLKIIFGTQVLGLILLILFVSYQSKERE